MIKKKFQLADEDQEASRLPNYIKATPKAFQYDFYLSGVIGPPELYTDMFHIIRNASPDDSITLHINSPGGDADTSIQLRRVLAESPAVITGIVEGLCASAATMIFLSCDNWNLTAHAQYMFHNYSGYAMGKGGEMYAQIQAEKRWSEVLMRDIYKDFLDEAEIQMLLDGKDIWMDTDEVGLRLEKKVSAIVAEHKKQEEPEKPKPKRRTRKKDESSRADNTVLKEGKDDRDN